MQNISPQLNSRNCKSEKNANFRRNFSLTKIYKKENDWTTKARKKNQIENFAELEEIPGSLR